jgi:heme/copper-type cytochrome/quinol oxidase subunit 3
MLSKSKLAMVLFIVSEANFFALLLMAYAYYHALDPGGANGAGALDVVTTGLYSVCLFSSSATLWAADRRLRRQEYRGGIRWLLATIALGAIFLYGQGREYARLLRSGVTVSRNLFGTTFFTLTGFHGLHVFLGLCALATLAGLALRSGIRERQTQAVEAVGLYWHFVDAVWVVIFGVVYLGSVL